MAQGALKEDAYGHVKQDKIKIYSKQMVEFTSDQDLINHEKSKTTSDSANVLHESTETVCIGYNSVRKIGF